MKLLKGPKYKIEKEIQALPMNIKISTTVEFSFQAMRGKDIDR